MDKYIDKYKQVIIKCDNVKDDMNYQNCCYFMQTVYSCNYNFIKKLCIDIYEQFNPQD